MEIITGVTSSVLLEIGKRVWSIAGSKINYFLCYDRKFKELKDLVQELNKKKKHIEQEVDGATRNGRIVDADVSQWLAKLNLVDEDAMRLEEQVEGVRRFMGCCWNCFSSYKIGKEVVEKINTAKELLDTKFTIYSHEPPPPSIDSLFPNRDFEESLSTKSSMDHIWEALNNEIFYIIGVYGMGGVGKTAIMKEVAKRAKNEGQCNEVIMVTVSQTQDVKKMQTEIAEQLDFKLTAESEIVRGAKLLDRIKGARKILIILDDLWDFLNIREIGIPSTDENKECKVVITTRSRDVCSSMGCQKHIKVEPLSEKESWDLFKLKVGDVVEKTDDLKKVALDVAKECGGLPLAIITLGRAMREKDDISTWIYVRNELRQSVQTHIKGMEDSVFKCIRRSFDFLKSDEAKFCLLLCSLFPEDWEIDIIGFFRYVMGEGILRHVYSMEEAWNRVCRLLDELKDCCLLLEGKDSEHYKMHDVVRDAAIWISSDRAYGFYGFANKGLRRWPEIAQVDECQRIYFTGNSFESLPAEQLVFPKLRTLILKETRILSIPDRYFQGMEALLVLDLRSEKVASLPSSFPCLVHLKALFLSRSGEVNFDVTSLSLIGELKNLEILQLEGFEFGSAVPMEFGNLTKLTCLDLLGCRGRLPRNLLSRLSRLEQLYLTGVFSNWQVDDEGSSTGDSCAGGCGAATFAELASLSCLTTLHVDIGNPDVSLQQQGDDLNFVPWPALTDFKIVVGVEASICPSAFQHRKRRSRSKQLAITKSTYKYKWVSDLVTKTERLFLHNWPGMECLIGSGAEAEEEEGLSRRVGNKLFEVKELYLHSMPDMKSLCSGKLSELESLEISSCDKLEKVLNLINLVQEEGEGGQSAAAAGGIVLLPRLRSILLIDLPELRSVWGDDGHGGVMMLPAGSLQNLQSLIVVRCERLKDDHILPPILPIPNKLDHFPSLRRLTIVGCHSLTYLLSWRQAKGQLPHLKRLYVWGCERMETLVTKEEPEEEEESHVLPSLTHLTLCGLPKLRSFFQGEQCSKPLSSLKNLLVVECPKLKKLPLSSSSSPPVNLQRLEGDSWEWFESLEWGEDQSIKERLRPLFQAMQQQSSRVEPEIQASVG
ncbi:putative LRR receptor-like serine/threonine-protein kinaseisoform X1 [Iris pallida]|uniref:LRR receptor-like serine/threonine-protein kinaseisoform X1 n=1 Tax=Iris pallida TaxID=29817 RepID=A0AAX6GH42_IRIPA|nr:putative LRR receptor-like serine/threonine-protein kinaseisoform X1 [Iris pallida]